MANVHQPAPTPNQTKEQTMTENRKPRRPQIPGEWTLETTAGQFEAWSKPDGCRAIVLRLPEATHAVTVRVFTGETAHMDATRHAEDMAVAERRTAPVNRRRLPLIVDMV